MVARRPLPSRASRPGALPALSPAPAAQAGLVAAGFALPLVIVVGLLLAIAMLVLSSRNNSGLLNAAREGQSREAVSAAQAGVALLFKTLNQSYPHLLVRDVAAGSVSDASAPAAWTTNLPSRVCGDISNAANRRLSTAPPATLTSNSLSGAGTGRFQLISYDFSGEPTQLGGPAIVRMRGWDRSGKATAVVEAKVWISAKSCGGAVGAVGTGFVGLGASYMQTYNDILNGNVTCNWKGTATGGSCNASEPVNSAALKTAIGASTVTTPVPANLTNLQLVGNKGGTIRYPDFPTMPATLNSIVAANGGKGITIYNTSVIVAGRAWQCLNIGNSSIGACDPLAADSLGANVSGGTARTQVCAVDASSGITDCAVWRIAFQGGANRKLTVYGLNGTYKYVRIWVTCDRASTISASACDANISGDTMGTNRQFHVMDTSGLYARGDYGITSGSDPYNRNSVHTELVSYLGLPPTAAGVGPGVDPMVKCQSYFGDANYTKSTRLEIHGSTIEGFYYFPCSYSDLNDTTLTGAYWLLWYKASSGSPATLNVPTLQASGIVDQFGNQFNVINSYNFEYAAIGITNWKVGSL